MSSAFLETGRVPVVGIGVIAPGAIGVDAFREMLRSGATSVGDIDRFDTSDLRSHRGALVKDFRPKDFISVMKMRRMNALSRMAVAAAKLTVSDAGWEGATPYQRAEIGVSLGTAFGPVQTSVDYLREYVEKGAALAPPQLFAESVANAPGSHVAIEMGLEGFNLTFTQRECSAITASSYACSQILKGSVRAALAGGVEELNETLYVVFDRIGALARATADRDEAARPFDRKRNGFIAGEGAAWLLLADSGDAYGCFSGFGFAKDVSATISDWGTGVDEVVRAMSDAIADAGLTTSDIDAIWASANSSVRGDRLEALAIRKLFAGAIPPVFASKAFFGEYAAAGALQLASSFLCIDEQMIPATPGYREPEPELELPVTTTLSEAPLRHILVNSIAAGGGIVSAVVSRA